MDLTVDPCTTSEDTTETDCSLSLLLPSAPRVTRNLLDTYLAATESRLVEGSNSASIVAVPSEVSNDFLAKTASGPDKALVNL